MAPLTGFRSLLVCSELVILFSAACADSLTVETGTQIPPEPAFQIEPANPNLTAGGSLQFRARSRTGAELPVHWRLQNPEFGSITSTGLLTSCWATGVTPLTAILQTDSTKQATTQITLVQPAVALVSVASLYYASNAAPARLDSIAGGIDASVTVAAGMMICREVTSVRLELVGPASVTLLGQATFAPGLTTNTTLTFHWNAGAVSPGPYGLRAVLTIRDHGDITSSATPLQVTP